MIHIPDTFSYIEAYLTLRCNFACPYCINQHTGVNRNRNELSAREWRLGLNSIDTNGLPITFGGGEPTFHPEFYEIVDGLDQKIKIDLLTNGSHFDVDSFMNHIPPDRFTIKGGEYKSIRISYHPKTSDPEKIVGVACRLQERNYSVGIFGLNHPENLARNVAMTELCRNYGVYFFVRDFLGYYDDRLYGYFRYPGALNGNKKSCECKTEEMLIGPEGAVYRCHRDLYDGSGAVGNILNMAFDIEDDFRTCENFGLCNPCDIKLKLGPDLTVGKCSVVIKK